MVNRCLCYMWSLLDCKRLLFHRNFAFLTLIKIMAFSLHVSECNDLWHWILVKTYKNVSVCLFVRVFRPTRESFTHMDTSLLPMNGCKVHILYARHSWPLNSDASLACHTYCDTGKLFIMVPWHWWPVKLLLLVFMTEVCRGWDSNTQSFRLRG